VSIPVEIDDLARAMTEYDAGYLLTSRGGRTKVAAVDAGVRDGAIVIESPSRGSSANLAENPCCTLMFPASEHHGFTLLVDGTATVDGERLTMRPETAVLHRPARHADGPPAPGAAADCVNDCRPVG
jgi:hypothetical protein